MPARRSGCTAAAWNYPTFLRIARFGSLELHDHRGEALSQLRRLAPEVADRISESGRIIAFRNQLIHGYGVIQPEITWSIIQDKLPTLLRELTALLSEP
jgi:uncharacterized protein YutE (UPF0331/DUF86 family)